MVLRNIQIVTCLTILGTFFISPAEGRIRLRRQEQVQTNLNIDEVNSKSVESFRKVISQCGERIWPQFNWKGFDVILVNKNNSEQIIYSPERNQSQTIKNGSLPPHAVTSSYSFFPLDNREAMSLNTVDFTNALSAQGANGLSFTMFQLGVHEGFHHLAQKNWKSNRTGSRGTEIPLLVEPRYYRFKTYRNLEQALLDPANANQHLARAAYWFQKWLIEYPSESQSTTDGYEGTAEYAEFIAGTLEKVGCEATEEQLKAAAVSRIASALGRRFDPTQSDLSLESEGYSLGSIASLVLRFYYPQENWFKAVAEGETPPSILLSKVKPQFEERDESLISALKKRQGEITAKINELLGTSVAEAKSKDSIYVVLPNNWRNGSYSALGFFIDRESKLSVTTMMNEMSFKSPDGTSHLTTQPKASFLSNLNSPCTSVNWIVAIPRSDMTEAGQTVTIKSKSVSGSIKNNIKVGTDGRTWVCSGD